MAVRAWVVFHGETSHRLSGRRASSIVAPFSMRRNPAGCVTACDAATCAQSRSKWRRRRWRLLRLRRGRGGNAFLLLPSKNDHTNFFLSSSIELLLEGLETDTSLALSHTRSGAARSGARTLNRLCAVSFIMPATPGPGASGPRVDDSSARSGPDGISLLDSRRSSSFARSNYESTEGRHFAYCINSHRAIYRWSARVASTAR